MFRSRLGSIQRVFWFGTVGALSTALYAALTWVSATQLALPAAVSSLISYAIAAGVSYTGHRLLTFRFDTPHHQALSRFIVVSIIGYVTAFAIPGFVEVILQGPIELSIAITCVAIPIMNYLALSRLVFRATLAVNM
jgi:putative flippase GtrA